MCDWERLRGRPRAVLDPVRRDAEGSGRSAPLSPMVEALRWIKSPAEQALLR